MQLFSFFNKDENRNKEKRKNSPTNQSHGSTIFAVFIYEINAKYQNFIIYVNRDAQNFLVSLIAQKADKGSNLTMHKTTKNTAVW